MTNLVRDLLRLLEIRPKQLVMPVLAGAGALGSAVALAAVSAWLVARASQHPPVVAVSLAVVAVRGLGVSRGVLRYVERLASHGVALRALVGLRARLYASLAGGRPEAVARLRRGDLLARWGADVDGLADVLVRGVLPFPVAGLVAAATVAGIASVHPGAAAALLTGLVLGGVVAPWLAARAARADLVGTVQERAAVAAQVHAVLEGLAELEVAGALPAALSAARRADDELARRTRRAAGPASLAAAAVPLGTGLAVLAALVLGAGPAASGATDPVWLAVLVLVPLATAELLAPLAAAAAELVRGRAALARVADVLAVPPAPPSTGVLPPPRGAVLQAHGLSCGRDGAVVLDGIDLQVRPGALVVVQGPSGSGKTTLLETLAGLLPPVAGRVTLGGADLADLDERSLRRAVTHVAEDGHVFATTVRENLRVAAGDVPDAVLLAALDAVGLAPWCAGLPDGLGTLLGADAVDLSGGERRRLLLARALLTGADVLLLDEPDEHLSADAVQEGWALLAGLVRGSGRAAVVVTHRPVPAGTAGAVLRIADQVAVAA